MMVEVIRRSGLLIPKKYRNKEFYVKVKDELTRITRAYQTSNIDLNYVRR